MKLLFAREKYGAILCAALRSERTDWHEALFPYVDFIVQEKVTRACRDCFIRYLLGGVTYRDVAEELGISESAVSKNLQKVYRVIRYQFILSGLVSLAHGDRSFVEHHVPLLVEKAMAPIAQFPREIFLACIDENRFPSHIRDLVRSFHYNGDLVLGLQGSLEEVPGIGRKSVESIADYLESIGLGDIEFVPLDVVDALLRQNREQHQ